MVACLLQLSDRPCATRAAGLSTPHLRTPAPACGCSRGCPDRAAAHRALLAAVLLLLVPVRPAAGPQLPECEPRGGLPNAFYRLQRGEELRVAYLGGSITAQEGWRAGSLRHLQEQYPQARVVEINAALGATGSEVGAVRLRRDVLAHRPHLLLVEFAVNDLAIEPWRIHRSMEGIVRQTWRNDPSTDICFVYTVHQDMLAALERGELPPSYAAMEAIAAHYGIPSVNLGVEIVRLQRAGQLLFRGRRSPGRDTAADGRILFSPDGVHPYADTGQRLYTEGFVRAMSAIRGAGSAGPHRLGDPFVADHWERARVVPLSLATLSAGWTRLEPQANRLARNFSRRMPELWRAERPGASIDFRFRGTAVGIHDLIGPDCGQIVIRIDDQAPVTVARFDAEASYHRPDTLMLGTGLPDTAHRVRVEVHRERLDKTRILSEHGVQVHDPGHFEGQAWYAGGILLVGELIEP